MTARSRLLVIGVVAVFPIYLECSAQVMTVKGRVFDLDGVLIRPGEVERGDTVRVSAVDETGDSVAVNEIGERIQFVSSVNGAYSIQVQTADSFDLQFTRDGFVTRTIPGLVSRLGRQEQTIDPTVPLPKLLCIGPGVQMVSREPKTGHSYTRRLNVGDVVVASSRTNLRVPSGISGVVQKSEQLQVRFIQRDWLFVRSGAQNGVQGWVKRRQVRFVSRGE